MAVGNRQQTVQSGGRTVGRDEHGRFTRGNPGGPGNPLAAHVSRLRSALLKSVTEDDMRAVVQSLLGAAKTGDVAAAKELLLRCLGRPLESDLLERLERLEAVILGEETAER